MTSVAQQIPNFVQGISDQPDILKFPGQVRDMVNMFPDVTRTVTKRPGTEYINTLGTDATGTWFSIHKENPTVIRERYIGCIKQDGEVHIWSCDSGKEMDIVYQTGGDLFRYPAKADLSRIVTGSSPDYFRHNNDQQLKIFSVNDYTFVCNPLRQVSMTGGWPANRRDFESFIEITSIAYNRQYALDINEPENDSEAVYFQATELEIYDVDGFNEELGACPQTFTATETFNESFGARSATNLRVEMTTTAQQIPDNNAYDCAYKHNATIRFGGERWRIGDTFSYKHTFQDNNVTDVEYNMRVVDERRVTAKASIALVRPTPTPATAEKTITAEEILTDLLDAITADSADFFEEARIVGNGIYLRAKKPFTVDTPEETLFNIITNQDEQRVVYGYGSDQFTWLPYYTNEGGSIIDLDDNDAVLFEDVDEGNQEDWYMNAYPKPVARVNNISNLPRECVNGLVVKVVNSENTKDDYYSVFKGNYSLDGKGVWEECAEPGGTHSFNPSSLPHQIVRSSETRRDDDNDLITKFVVSAVDWNPREAGDDDTVPRPSFAPVEGKPNSGKTISNIKLFRNRFVLLSDENVVTSRAGDFFNLFGKSALTVTADDPIDLTASSNYASYPSDCIVINAGLVILSPFNQFLLTTENDVFSPATAKIKDISSYDFNINSEPFYLGTNIGFLATETSASKLYEMSGIQTSGQPTVDERSKHVAQSLSANLSRIAASKELGLVLMSDAGKTVWGYKYFKVGDEYKQSAFFKWTFHHDVVDHCIMDDVYYVVFSDGSNTQLGQINLGEFIQQGSFEQDLSSSKYVDLTISLTPSNGTITVPYNGEVEVYKDGSPVAFTQDGNVLTLSENEPVNVGIPYTSSITLPTIYVSKTKGTTTNAEWSGSLVVHRLKFQMGLHGAYNIHIRRKGRDDYNVLYESTIQDAYPADFNPSIKDVERVVPVYCRNTDMELSISSSFPTPMTIHSLQWEGDYNPKYYKIV